MKKNILKFLCLITVISVSVALFTACGKTEEQKHEHSFGEWVVTHEPTCTENGEKRRTCECGETKTKTIDKKEHTPDTVVVENKKDSTCTATGSYDEVVYCSVCHGELS